MPRRNRRSRKQVLRYEEVFTFSLNNGASTSVQVSTLGNRPPRSNFRPVYLEVEAVQPWVPATSALPAYFCPGAIQLTLNNPLEKGDPTATSQLVMLGSSPRKVRVRYPQSALWWSWDTSGSDVIATIDAVCAGTTSPGTAFVRGIGRMLIALQVEDIATSCAIPHLTTQSPSESWTLS